jgi:hypothetical protein
VPVPDSAKELKLRFLASVTGTASSVMSYKFAYKIYALVTMDTLSR